MSDKVQPKPELSLGATIPLAAAIGNQRAAEAARDERAREANVVPMCKGCEKLFGLLTAERAEHAKEVADLNEKLKAWDTWYALFGDRDLETQIIDLKQRISELEAQKPVIYVLKEES